jgi:hypothetical protein
MAGYSESFQARLSANQLHSSDAFIDAFPFVKILSVKGLESLLVKIKLKCIRAEMGIH